MNYNTTEVETTESPSEEKVHSSLVGYTADARFEAETQNSKEKKYPPATFKQVEDALSHISADIDRDEWVKIGMAIKSEFGDEGIDLFNEWSEAGKSYKFDDLVATWDSINAEGGINIGFLFKLAIDEGWKFKHVSSADIKAATARKKKVTTVKQNHADDKEKYKAGADKAQSIWIMSSACNAAIDNSKISFPYLTSKKIKPHGSALRNSDKNDALLVPLYYQGELVSLQIIETLPDGTFQKKNMKGGKAKGSYFVIGSEDGHEIPTSDLPIFICEGFATGCTLNEQTGNPVVITFSCNNYKSVVLQIKEQYPDRRLVIAADNDFTNDNNPGLNKAKEIANELEIEYVYPDFETAGLVGSDFNDFYNSGGTREHIIIVEPVIKTVYPNIPNGYDCTDDGVVEITDRDPLMITGTPIYVLANTHNEAEENYGVALRWRTMRGTDIEKVIPKAELLANQSKIPGYLASMGVDVDDPRRLMSYLKAAKSKEFIKSADKTGWIGDNTFVLPAQTIREPAGERILYGNGQLSTVAKSIISQGSLAEWQQGMMDASVLVIFGVCSSLSAPVRYKVGVESGGIHFYGQTSQGKTTLLQTIASVWGNGADPQRAGGQFIYLQKWNSTTNATEATAEQFNDLPFVIDEIGESDPKTFGQGIYRLLSGVGKARADIFGGRRDNKSWRVLLFSAGEVPVSQFIEDSGETMKGGQAVRLTDIDITANGELFKDAADADAMKDLCAAHYGLAGPAFLKAIPDLAQNWESVNHDAIGPADNPIAKRVRKRFALAAYAGHMASEAGLLPWTSNQILDAVQQVYKNWQVTSNLVSDDVRGMQSVRDYINLHDARFERPGNDEHPTQNRSGWYRNRIYYFTPAAFKKACGGASVKQVKTLLHSEKYQLLHTNRTDTFNVKFKMSGQKDVQTVAVKEKILEL